MERLGTYTYFWNKSRKTLGQNLRTLRVLQIPEKPSREDLGISDDAPDSKETGVFNMLLFGLDSRAENQNSRSDVIMIATIDKKNEAIKLTSLMRDMYVSIGKTG